MHPCIFRGVGFARSICNTKAKLAINRRINNNLTNCKLMLRKCKVDAVVFVSIICYN